MTTFLLYYLVCSLLAVVYAECSVPGGCDALAAELRDHGGPDYAFVNAPILRFSCAALGPFVLISALGIECRRLWWAIQDVWYGIALRVRIYRAILFLRRRGWDAERFMVVASFGDLLALRARVKRAKAWTAARGWSGPWID